MKMTIHKCAYVYENCRGVASIHVCALKYACACICVWALDCVSGAHARTYVHALGYRSVQECAYSMCIYACVCVCVHVYTYINILYVRSCLHVEMWCVHMYVRMYLHMVWFAWQLAMQVTTQNDALLW